MIRIDNKTHDNIQTQITAWLSSTTRQKKANAARGLYQALSHAKATRAAGNTSWKISDDLLKQALQINPTRAEMKERFVAEARLVNAARKVIAISKPSPRQK